MPGNIESHTSYHSPDSRAQEIRAYLGRLVAGEHFSAASRRGQLLRYLVEHTLKGDADKINEYAIGLDVFQRPASFDPRIESVVRTEFSRLRQRLRDYYAEDGRRDTIVIEFPPRSYEASFTFRDASKLREPTAFPEPILAPQLVPPSARSARRIWLIGSIAVPFIAAAGVAGIMLWRQHISNMLAKQPIHAIARSATCCPAYFSFNRPVGTKRPITVASTPSDRQSAAARPTARAHRQDHPLLGFGNPDFGIRQAVVLDRRFVEPDLGPDLFAHLADGAGETAGAAIGHGVVQPAVAGGQQHVEHHFLGDRVADLHGSAREAFALAGQFGRAERGAVDAVAAGAAAEGHDVVAGLRLLERFVARDAAPRCRNRPADCPGSARSK